MFSSLIKFLMPLGQVIQAKTCNGVNIYNPTSFDLQALELLAQEVGFVVVYNPQPSLSPEGNRIPPRLFVGKSSALDAEGLADVFQQTAEK